MRDKESCAAGDMCKLVVGGLIGAGIALLLAPQTGKKTRKYLACCAKDLGEKANEAASDFSETFSDFMDTAGKRAGELFEEGVDLTQDSKKSLLSALDKGLEKLAATRKKLADMMG